MSWFLLVAPVLAGLLYGPLLYRFAPGPLGQGVAEVMYAADHRDRRMPVRAGATKVAAAALCIAGGGSVGRVGPIVELSATIGSAVGQAVRA